MQLPLHFKKAFVTVWVMYSVAFASAVFFATVWPAETVLIASPACYSVKYFGRECFMCGSVRSFIQSGDGNFAAAVSLNPIAAVLYWLIIANTISLVYILITKKIKNRK